MSTLSTLQILPLHVVKRIVDHVIGSIRLCHLGFGDTRWPNEYLRPLTMLCHNFRNIAYPRLCRYLKLEPNDTQIMQTTALSKRSGYPSNAHLGHHTHHLVKDLELKLSEQAIYSGKALKSLSNAPYDACAFPLAKKLTLTLDWEDPRYSDAHEANIDAFIRWIGQVAPSVNRIRIQPGASVHDSGVIASIYFGRLISRLYQLAEIVELDNYVEGGVFIELQFDSISHLTGLSYTSIGLEEEFTALARRNAPTLQSLVVDSEVDVVDIGSLIANADGSSVVFPCLLKLCLDVLITAKASRNPDHTGPAPFPRLRHLSLGMDSNLDMYVFFRGNAATLEFLNVMLDSSMVAMIRGGNLFTPTSHPNLHCVKVLYPYGLIPEVFATAAEAKQFSLRIGPTAPVRTIGEPSLMHSQMPVHSLLEGYTCIQVLSLPEAGLELWDVFSLIKSLPLLSDLYTFSTRLGPLPEGKKKSELPAYVISTYAPMGKRFRCWHFGAHKQRSLVDVAECVLLLALACPALDYAVQHVANQSDFLRSVRKVIASDTFKDYEPRLRRFL
ncbi:hypothetical protein LPJ60_002115 [Coemansia sp. RSA 2675]|nr:hypothetical protein LPJ60_002115 [Coemansia sp. RSA 2675]